MGELYSDDFESYSTGDLDDSADWDRETGNGLGNSSIDVITGQYYQSPGNPSDDRICSWAGSPSPPSASSDWYVRCRVQGTSSDAFSGHGAAAAIGANGFFYLVAASSDYIVYRNDSGGWTNTGSDPTNPANGHFVGMDYDSGSNQLHIWLDTGSGGSRVALVEDNTSELNTRISGAQSNHLGVGGYDGQGSADDWSFGDFSVAAKAPVKSKRAIGDPAIFRTATGRYY